MILFASYSVSCGGIVCSTKVGLSALRLVATVAWCCRAPVVWVLPPPFPAMENVVASVFRGPYYPRCGGFTRIFPSSVSPSGCPSVHLSVCQSVGRSVGSVGPVGPVGWVGPVGPVGSVGRSGWSFGRSVRPSVRPSISVSRIDNYPPDPPHSDQLPHEALHSDSCTPGGVNPQHDRPRLPRQTTATTDTIAPPDQTPEKNPA